MSKSHAMARCQGYIASVKKGKKKKTKPKKRKNECKISSKAVTQSYLGKIMPKKSYSAKQRKLAAVAPPRDKITAADLKKLRSKKKKKKK